MRAVLSLHGAYGDEALAQASSPGLLRRSVSDLPKASISMIRGDAEHVELAVDDQVVTLRPGGLQAADCTCPAAVICRHRLMVCLWLRTGAPATTEQCRESHADPLKEILETDFSIYAKEAGKATVKKAVDYVQTLPIAKPDTHVDGRFVRIRFGEPEWICHYAAGGGLAGMVSDLPANRKTMGHLAAILAVRRTHGRVWHTATAPEQNHGGATGMDAGLADEIKGAMKDLLKSGLSHVSAMTEGRFRALAMSTRAENHPQVAGWIRGLSSSIARLAQRDPQQDEGEVMMELARGFALLESSHPWVSGAGIARDDGPMPESMAVWPLGAHYWESPGGARGMTLSLWDLDGHRLLTVTLARPDGHDPTFTRASGWSVQPVFVGGVTAQYLCGGAWILKGARGNGNDRLAPDAGTRVESADAIRVDEGRKFGISDWADLERELRNRVHRFAPIYRPLLLAVGKVGEGTFDAKKQMLSWPVADTHGNWITLAMPFDESRKDRLMSLEQAIHSQVKIQHVLVVPLRKDNRIILEPVSLIYQHGPALQSLSLDYQILQATTPLPHWLGRLLNKLPGVGNPMVHEMEPKDRVEGVLTLLLNELESMAEMGRLDWSEESRLRVKSAILTLEALGLDILSENFKVAISVKSLPVNHLFRLVYLVEMSLVLNGLPKKLDQAVVLE